MYVRITLVMIVIKNGFMIRKTNIAIAINSTMKKYFELSVLILATFYYT